MEEEGSRSLLTLHVFFFFSFQTSCGKKKWWCSISRGICSVVSGTPGEQLLAPVTSTHSSPRQQVPAPALQPPVTCPHAGQGDFWSLLMEKWQPLQLQRPESQVATSWPLCPLLSSTFFSFGSLTLCLFSLGSKFAGNPTIIRQNSSVNPHLHLLILNLVNSGGEKTSMRLLTLSKIHP